MKKQLSIKELIDCKFGQFAEKDAFLMFIQDECEVRGINAEETIRYVQYAKKKFEHQEAWEALIKEKDASEELKADATFEQFLGEITRVHVQFKTDDCAILDYRFLNNGLDILSKHGFDHYKGAYIPATTGYDFLVYIPAKIVPDEFIRQYVEQHTF
jgi:hypothetical protein